MFPKNRFILVLRCVELVSACLIIYIWANTLLIEIFKFLRISINYNDLWMFFRMFPRILSILLVFWLVVHVYKKNSHNIGVLSVSKAKLFRGMILGAVCVISLLLIYSRIYGNSFIISPLTVILWGIVVVLIQSFSEEVIFRGFVLRFITARWNIFAGIGISAFLFGLFHIFDPRFNLMFFLILCLSGVFYALYKLVIDKGSLWGVVGFHAAWNFIQEFILRANFPSAGLINALGMILIFGVPIFYMVSLKRKRGILKSFRFMEKEETQKWEQKD